MVKFISENWANILLIIVGSFALATYILQERKKKIDAASLIVLQLLSSFKSMNSRSD